MESSPISLTSDVPLPDSSSKHFEQLKAAVAIINEPVSDGWSKVTSTSNLSVYKKTFSGDPVPTARVHAFFADRTPEQLVVTFADEEVRLKWDDSLKSLEKVEKNPEEGYAIVHTVKKSPMMFVDPRENVAISRYEPNVEGRRAHFIHTEPTEHAKLPVTSKAVRAENHTTLFVELVSENPLVTRLVLLIKVDPKGNLTSKAANMPDKLADELVPQLEKNSKGLKDAEERFEKLMSLK